MLASRFLSSGSPMNAARAIARSSANPTHARSLHLGRQRSALSSPLRQISKSSAPTLFAGQSRSFFWNSSDAPKAAEASQIAIRSQPDQLSSTIAESTGYVKDGGHMFWPGTIPEEHIAEVAAEVARSTSVAPDQFGYLASLGIEFGWGPSTVMQYIFEYIHVLTGFGWAGSILATVVVVRSLQFPLYCKMSHNAALMKETAPMTAVATEKMKKCKAKNDLVGMMAARQEMAKITRDNGCNPTWLFFPITQIPIFYGMFQNLKAMTNLPVPAFLHDGFLHFQNLGLPDPYLILPLICSSTLAGTLLMGGEAGSNTISRKMKITMGFLFPITAFFIYKSWGAGLVLYFAANGMWSLGQATLFRNEKFREWWGIHPLNKVVLNPLGPVQNLNIDPKVAQELAKFRGEKKYEEVKPEEDKRSIVDKAYDFIGDKLYGKPEPGQFMQPSAIDKFLDNNRARSHESEHKTYEQVRKKKLEEQKRMREMERAKRARMRERNVEGY